MTSGLPYDAFISYSHAADRPVALAVQRGLHRLAKRWYQVRALRVFRDDTSLSANPHLWAAIEQGLRGSRHFVLMASPEAANSHWVGKEIAYWQQNREPETFLIVHTKGTIAWDGAANDFDWSATDALPRDLSGWFRHEPLWVTLDEKRRSEGLSLRNATFRGAVCQLAAPLHGVAPDELDSEDIRRHRVTSRVRTAAVTALGLMLITAVTASVIAVSQRNEARTQTLIAGARALAAEADVVASGDPILAARLSLAAYRLDPTAVQSRQSLLRALDRNRHVARFHPRGPLGAGVWASSSGEHGAVAVGNDGSVIAVGAAYTGRVEVFDTESGREVAVLHAPSEGQRTVPELDFSPDGKALWAVTANHVTEWDTSSWQPRARRAQPQLKHRTRSATGVRFTAQDRSLTIEAQANQVFTLDAELNRAELLFTMPNSVTDIALSADGTVGAVLDMSGNLVVLRPRHDRRFDVLTGASGTALVVSPDGSRLAIERDGRVELWQLDGERRRIAEFPTSVPRAAEGLDSPTAAFSHDSALFAYDTGNQISVRDRDGTATRAEPAAPDPRDRAKTVAQALGSGYLVSQQASQSNSTVHAVTAGGTRQTADGTSGPRLGARRDRASAVITSHPEAEMRKRISTWMFGAGGDFVEVGALDVLADYWPNLAVSTDARFIAISQPVPWKSQVIDVAGGVLTELTAGSGQAARSSMFAFAGNNEFVVEHVQPTEYYDYGGRVLLWDRATGALLGELDDHGLRKVNPHEVSLGIAAVSSWGAVSVRDDGSLAVWRIQPDDWARGLCELVGEFDENERANYLKGFEVGRLCP